jgi:hypothetical protein
LFGKLFLIICRSFLIVFCSFLILWLIVRICYFQVRLLQYVNVKWTITVRLHFPRVRTLEIRVKTPQLFATHGIRPVRVIQIMLGDVRLKLLLLWTVKFGKTTLILVFIAATMNYFPLL